MTAREPLYWDQSIDSHGELREMSPTELLEWQEAIIDHYAANPTVTLSVVSGSGTLSPTMADTRLQAGASSTHVSSFPNEATTAEPSTVTVNYDKVSGPTYDTSVSGTDDNGYNFPLYYNDDTKSVQPMNLQDFKDTFIHPAIDLMISASESNQTGGTYTINTSTSVTNYTEVSGANTVIYADTRADTSAYTAAGIPETEDQPTTINSYYLHRRDAGSTTPSNKLLYLDNSFGPYDIKEYNISEATTLIGTWLRHLAAESTDGYKITYSITTDGSGGNARGSSMVDTKLNGSGAYTTKLINTDDYRAQEFPNGSPATVTTYTLRITKS